MQNNGASGVFLASNSAGWSGGGMELGWSFSVVLFDFVGEWVSRVFDQHFDGVFKRKSEQGCPRRRIVCSKWCSFLVVSKIWPCSSSSAPFFSDVQLVFCSVLLSPVGGFISCSLK